MILLSIEVKSFRLVEPPTPSPVSNVPILGSLFNELGINSIGPNAAHFLYNIHVSVVQPQVVSLEINKRFSELAQLDQNLSAMTKFLPSFPPRGAQRILTTQHAQDRMKMLNTYFSIISRMEEVVQSAEFLTFFGLYNLFVDQIPNKVGEISLSLNSSNYRLSSLSVSNSFVVTAMSSSLSALNRASSFVLSLIGSRSAESSPSSQIEVWKRLPNSNLCELREVQIFAFGITSTVISDLRSLILFGTSDGRAGYLTCGDSDSCESGFLSGLVHVGPVRVLHLCEEEMFLWSGGEDGCIQKFSLVDKRLVVRISSNGEGAAVTSIASNEDDLVLFVGLSSGVVSIFNEAGGNIRQVTLLQGPVCPVVSLHLSGNFLLASHAGVIMDSAEGANTIQFWDVSDVLIRGTSKLAPWGPFPSPIVGSAMIESCSTVVVAGANGAINLFNQSQTELTNRAKRIFRLPDTLAVVVSGDIVFLGTSSRVEMWKLPPFDQAALDNIDVSSAQVCHTQPRTFQNHVHPLQTLPPVSIPREDDLHSWAR